MMNTAPSSSINSGASKAAEDINGGNKPERNTTSGNSKTKEKKVVSEKETKKSQKKRALAEKRVREDALNSLSEKILPAGGGHAKHERNTAFLDNFTRIHHHLPPDEFADKFVGEGYEIYDYDAKSQRWESVGEHEQREQVKRRRTNFLDREKKKRAKILAEGEGKVEEARSKGNFLACASADLQGGRLYNQNGSYSYNSAMTLDVVRVLKRTYQGEVGKYPTILDVTTGEGGFQSKHLKREGKVISLDKYKNRTANPNYKHVEPYEPTLTRLEEKRDDNIVSIVFCDLPYLGKSVAGHHMGNSDLDTSQPFIIFHRRYGIQIKWTATMLLFIHIKLFIRLKKILPANGGFLLVKSMRGADNGGLDLTHQIDRLLKENGFEEKGCQPFPSNINKKDHLLHLQLDDGVAKSYLKVYRTTSAKVEHGGMPTMRLHEYLKLILPKAVRDAKALVGRYIMECHTWRVCAQAFFTAALKAKPGHTAFNSTSYLFGTLGEEFAIEQNNLVWKHALQSNQVDNFDILEHIAVEMEKTEKKLAAIAFIFFCELLRVKYGEENDNHKPKYDREEALLGAGIRDKATRDLFLNSTVERLFKNESIVQKDYEARIRGK